jgi:Ni/Co efflux regulator RcnB
MKKNIAILSIIAIFAATTSMSAQTAPAAKKEKAKTETKACCKDKKADGKACCKDKKADAKDKKAAVAKK